MCERQRAARGGRGTRVARPASRAATRPGGCCAVRRARGRVLRAAVARPRGTAGGEPNLFEALFNCTIRRTPGASRRLGASTLSCEPPRCDLTQAPASFARPRRPWPRQGGECPRFRVLCRRNQSFHRSPRLVFACLIPLSPLASGAPAAARGLVDRVVGDSAASTRRAGRRADALTRGARRQRAAHAWPLPPAPRHVRQRAERRRRRRKQRINSVSGAVARWTSDEAGSWCAAARSPARAACGAERRAGAEARHAAARAQQVASREGGQGGREQGAARKSAREGAQRERGAAVTWQAAPPQRRRGVRARLERQQQCLKAAAQTTDTRVCTRLLSPACSSAARAGGRRGRSARAGRGGGGCSGRVAPRAPASAPLALMPASPLHRSARAARRRRAADAALERSARGMPRHELSVGLCVCFRSVLVPVATVRACRQSRIESVETMHGKSSSRAPEPQPLLQPAERLLRSACKQPPPSTRALARRSVSAPGHAEARVLRVRRRRSARSPRVHHRPSVRGPFPCRASAALSDRPSSSTLSGRLAASQLLVIMP